MNLQVVIIAHEQGIAAFKRHEKFWLAHQAPILVVTPEGDDLQTEHEVLATRGRQHHGEESWKRLHQMFAVLAQREWDRVVIYEYDSFSIDGALPTLPGLYGNLFLNNEAPKFMAQRYVNPPWCLDRLSFEKMDQVRRDYPSVREDGEADRWISALAMLAGVPVLDYEPKGFSRGRIDGDDVKALETAIYRGARMIHGVKSEWLLGNIRQYMDQRHLPHAQEIARQKP